MNRKEQLYNSKGMTIALLYALQEVSYTLRVHFYRSLSVSYFLFHKSLPPTTQLLGHPPLWQSLFSIFNSILSYLSIHSFSNPFFPFIYLFPFDSAFLIPNLLFYYLAFPLFIRFSWHYLCLLHSFSPCFYI